MLFSIDLEHTGEMGNVDDLIVVELARTINRAMIDAEWFLTAPELLDLRRDGEYVGLMSFH